VPYSEIIEILNKNNIKKPDFAVVRLGVNTEKFKQPEKEEINRVREKYHIEKNKIIVSYIGRVSREKGINVLIEAFESLKREYEEKYENVQLLIAGKGIPEITNNIKNRPGIIYREINEDSSNIMKAIDIFIMPSLIETTSLVTLEAMSTQKIVIASSVGFVKQYIEDRENGFLFNRGNASQLKIKLKFALDNINRLDDMRRKARETILNRFIWENTAQEIIKILDEF
jgi:1,2-diacylglycerol 3-alpha-glucosyltransferase